MHWPFCRKKCPYCDFNSHVCDNIDTLRWKNALLAEMDAVAMQVGARRLVSLFFGGGTPSLMPPEIVAAVIERAYRHWPPGEEEPEITLEANPTSVEAANFRACREAGVNRVSLGVQSLRDETLRALGREHSVAEALEAVALARDIFPRHSFDLIYAHPWHSPQEWRAELMEARAHIGGHASLYQLTIEPGTAFAAQYKKGLLTMPDDDRAAAFYSITQQVMEGWGLPAYEVSNHAAPGEESRHNLTYWRYGDYAGIGPGAHGRLRLVDESGEEVVWATEAIKSPQRWLERVCSEGHALTWERLDVQEAQTERLLMGLRLTEGLPRDALLEQVLDGGEVIKLQEEGYLAPGENRLMLAPAGRLLLNSITARILI